MVVTGTATIPEPGALRVGRDGTLDGRTGGYQKRLSEMAGVYRDAGAYQRELNRHGPEHLVYQVAEHRNSEDAGALVIGTSTLLPGRYGAEYAMTRGHLHRVADRAELYHCLSGRGVLLMETLDGRSRAVPMEPGDAVHVPGHWVHRSINTGDEPLVTLFCYPADAGQNYELIARAGGMSQLIVDDGSGGWAAVANPDHTGYPEVTA